MGNCMFGGLGIEEEGDEIVEVMTWNNGIMEFVSPITVERITDEFPGHGVFRRRDLFWKPVPEKQVLLGGASGESYYLIPLNKVGVGSELGGDRVVRSNSSSSSSSSSSSVVQPAQAPYRMSFDNHGVFKRSSYTQAHRNKKQLQLGAGNNGGTNTNNLKNNGFWKVKLVISPQQLVEILSQDSTTHELIHNVRTVAKCGNININSGKATLHNDVGAFSDQWSLSSSRNASNKDFILHI